MEHHNQESSEGRKYLKGMEHLVGVVQKLSLARSIDRVVEIVRHAARELTGADGATFILSEGDLCHYVDEDAIAPLWKGMRFPKSACISGWAMIHRKSAIIADIYEDPRIPADAYRPTFVKSLVMVPVRKENPIAAIGNYWAARHEASPQEVALLQALADSTSIAVENVQLYSNLSNALEETRATRDELSRQLNLRDEFVSVCAHELKTPLTPLMIQIQLLQKLVRAGHFRGLPEKTELEKTVRIVVSQLFEFTKRIDDLLDVSRIRLGQFTFELDDGVDLAQIITRVIEDYDGACPTRISAHLSGELTGRWDPIRLEQAVRNLVSNAIKFGEKKPVKVIAEGERDRVQFRVQDSGFGISKEDQERIFDRFERATSIKSFGGLGLGLFITRQIVEGQEGTIRVESEPGQGATFIVELPKIPEQRETSSRGTHLTEKARPKTSPEMRKANRDR